MGPSSERPVHGAPSVAPASASSHGGTTPRLLAHDREMAPLPVHHTSAVRPHWSAAPVASHAPTLQSVRTARVVQADMLTEREKQREQYYKKTFIKQQKRATWNEKTTQEKERRQRQVQPGVAAPPPPVWPLVFHAILAIH